MREIKFRAWNVNTGRMAEWDEVHDEYGFKYLLENSITIPMQYTGLKDKNGKEIYEGDVLRRAKEGDTFKFHIVVEFGGGSFFGITRPGGNYRLTADNWGTCDYDGGGFDEVIGNIYENPDLLTT